jgi:hypothetical protein
MNKISLDKLCAEGKYPAASLKKCTVQKTTNSLMMKGYAENIGICSDGDNSDVIEYKFDFKRVKTLGTVRNFLWISASNSIDGELGNVIIDFENMKQLPTALTQMSCFFEDLDWNSTDDYVGLLYFIKRLKQDMPVVYTSLNSGFVHAVNGDYYVGSDIIDLEKPDCVVPMLNTQKVSNDTTGVLSKAKSLVKNGDVNLVKRLICKITKERIIMQVVIAAAFASILVGWLRLNPFLFCLSGRSSRGKTTVLNLVASLFSSPKDQQLNKVFAGTNLYLKDALSGKVGTLVTIDDTSTTANFTQSKTAEHNIKDLSYFISTGQGRGRVNRCDSSFNTICFITSEDSVVDKFEMQTGGARRRIVELWLDDTDNHLTKNAEEAHEINRIISENYGLLANDFVRNIAKNFSASELRSEYDNIRLNLQKELSSDGIAQGYGEMISTIVFAAKLLGKIDISFDYEEIGRLLIDDFEVSQTRWKKTRACNEVDFKQLYTTIVNFSLKNHMELTKKENGMYIYLGIEDEASVCNIYKFTPFTLRQMLFKLNLIDRDSSGHYTHNVNGTRMLKIKSIDINEEEMDDEF